MAYTVGELRKLLADESILDNLPILAPGSDHSYYRVRIGVGTARYVRSENYFCEDWGDDAAHRPEEKVINALILG